TALFLMAPDPAPWRQDPLAPFDILKLVGFATGAALHLYLCLMLYRRYGVRHTERTLLAMGLSAGLWHLGNFAGAIHELLNVNRAWWWLKASNVVAYTALAFMPPVLVHAHLRVWEWFDKRGRRKFFRPLIILGYLPLAVLPGAIIML